MDTRNRYSPIDCSFHDILLDRATRRKKISVAYLSSGKRQQLEEVIILDVFTKNKEEFMTLDSGEMIRLDYLVSVDGVPLPEGGSCYTKN